MANPTATDATVEAVYARPDGTSVTRQYTVRANSRFSVYVEAIPGLEDTPVSTTVTSTNAVPIVVERAMYWPGGFFDYYEGHSSAGSTTTARHWVVAGGEEQTYVLIANTSNQPGIATVSHLPARGVAAPAPTSVNLPPNSRTTVAVATPSRTFGLLVESAGPTPVDLVVESAVYSISS